MLLYLLYENVFLMLICLYLSGIVHNETDKCLEKGVKAVPHRPKLHKHQAFLNACLAHVFTLDMQ